jgi:Na+/melibiose symporter-like transporter
VTAGINDVAEAIVVCRSKRGNRKPWWLIGLAMFVIMMILIFAIFAVSRG